MVVELKQEGRLPCFDPKEGSDLSQEPRGGSIRPYEIVTRLPGSPTQAHRVYGSTEAVSNVLQNRLVSVRDGYPEAVFPGIRSARDSGESEAPFTIDESSDVLDA